MAADPARAARRTAAHGVTVFSTGGLADAERIRLWEDHNAGSLIALRCRTADRPALDATELNAEAGDIGLARVLGTPHVVRRSRRLIDERPSGSVACYLTLRGEASFSHSAGRERIHPGQMLVCDADQPFIRDFPHGLDELVIRIPRHVILESVLPGPLRSPVVCDLRARGARGRTLIRLVGGAVGPQHQRPADSGLVLALLGAILGGHHQDARAVHFAAAGTVIDDLLADPGLDVSTIAAAIDLSPRHLSRVFARAGVSVPQYVLTRRLERAHAMLRAGTDRPIAALAAECGFRSSSRFARAFRGRYGVRPSDVRSSLR